MQGRIPPVTDTKMIVAWNSLMISGLARATAVFQKPSYWELATNAAKFILAHQWVNGHFHRLNYDGQPSVMAQSEDYALFIKALLDLHSASLLEAETTSFWLENAIKVQAEFDQLLWSQESGGYYNATSDGSQELLVKERSYADNATPSANGIAIANLVRLALLTENLQYLDRAQQALQAFSSVMKFPQSCPSLFTALDWYQHCTLIRSEHNQLKALITQYFPASIYQLETNLPEQAIGLVCQGLSCLEPAISLEKLLEQVQQSQNRKSLVIR